jgi:hypothetical protein
MAFTQFLVQYFASASSPSAIQTMMEEVVLDYPEILTTEVKLRGLANIKQQRQST